MSLSRTLIFHFLIGLMALLTANPTWAGNKYMYSFGGAGDLAENTFTADFKLLSVSAKGYGWKNQILFNGSHQQDLDEVQKAAGDPTKGFSDKNLTDSLQQIAKDATANKIKTGDQVLIVIDTHGTPDSSGKSHKVACNDSICDLGKLDQTVRTLEAKGVKVAIVDLSCYSGHSQNLASAKTCVISGTTADDVGWSTFATHFISSIHPGQSLEDVFLTARKQPTSFGLPQISTAAGAMTTATIRNLGSESVVRVDAKEMAESPEKNICQMNATQIMKTAWQLDGLENKLNALAYTQATANYKKIYSQAQALAEQIKQAGGARQVKDANGLSFTWSYLANHDETWLKENMYGGYQLRLALKSDPSFQKLMKLQTAFDKLTTSQEVGMGTDPFAPHSPLADTAIQTQQAEKVLYDKIYRNSRAHEQKGNPCADFIF